MALLTPEWSTLGKLRNFTQLSMRSVQWPVELISGGGIALTSNGGSTARATSNAPVEATDTWKHMTGRFEIGYDDLTANDSGKFASAQIEKQLKYQAADKAKSFRRSVAIGFYGQPDAILFLTAAGASEPDGTTLKMPITALYGITGVLPKRVRDYVTKNKDRIAVIGNPYTAPAIVAEGIVTGITEGATPAITIESNVTAATITAGMAIVLYNQIQHDGTTDLNQGMNGLYHLTNSLSVHGLSETDYPDWAPRVRIANLAAALTGSKLYTWFEEIEQASDHAPQWVYTTTGVIASAGGTQLDQRRYGADEDTMRLGFKKLNVMGVQAEGRPFVPSGQAYIGSNTALRKLSPDEALDPKDVVQNGDRAGGFKQYQDTLGFYKDQVMRAQLTVVSRLGLGFVGGITEEN